MRHLHIQKEYRLQYYMGGEGGFYKLLAPMLWENIIENIHRLIKIIMQSLLVFSLFLCLGWKLTEIVENYETS